MTANKSNFDEQPGPIWGKYRYYRCRACGNTRLFAGEATIKATFLTNTLSPFIYDVMEYILKEDKSTFKITKCALCSSTDIEYEEIKYTPFDEFCCPFDRCASANKDFLNPNTRDPHPSEAEIPAPPAAPAKKHPLTENEEQFNVWGRECKIRVE